MKQLTTNEAINRLELQCSKAELCIDDVRQRLYRWRVPRCDIQRIIDHLVDSLFVDDYRFARAFVADHYRFAGWGRNKIRSALRAKRIDAATIDDAMDLIDNREYQLKAYKVISSRLRTIKTRDDETRNRLLRFGVNRGYEISLITRILNSERLWLE